MIDFKKVFVSGSTVRTAGALTTAGLLLGACHYHVPVPGPHVVIGPGHRGHGHYHGHYGHRRYYYRNDDYRHYRR